LFPDTPGRETVLFLIASDDHNKLVRFTRTYLESLAAHDFGASNFANARILYERYNVKFKVLSSAEELFQAIKTVAQFTRNQKIACTIVVGHGEYRTDVCTKMNKCIGIKLGKENSVPNGGWFLGEHTPIPAGAFSPLVGGKLVFQSCNLLDPGSAKIAWVDFIFKHTINTTVIAATTSIGRSQIHVSVIPPHGEIRFCFGDAPAGDGLTYRLSPSAETVGVGGGARDHFL
jgi:hypothetical protein